MTQAVILQHAALAGLPQGTAEEYYILAAQQLDGYGQETFPAKVGLLRSSLFCIWRFLVSTVVKYSFIFCYFSRMSLARI